MQLNAYSDFIADCDIEDKDSVSCKGSDLDSIFIVTNYEFDKKSEASKVNDARKFRGTPDYNENSVALLASKLCMLIITAIPHGRIEL